MSRIVTSAVGLVMLCGCAKPPALHLERLDNARIQQRLEAATERTPAIVFGAAWSDGQTLVLPAGHADLRRGRLASPRTPFAWFSITKLFTATAVLQLAEQGRIALDAPAERYLPGMRIRREGRQATVRQLLSHTAGIKDPGPEIVTWIHLADERGPAVEDMVRRRIGSDPALDFVPGARTAYSNLGYVLLGSIIERVSQQRYETYVAENVLVPLGCRTSGFAVPRERATGYQKIWSMSGAMALWMIDDRFFGPSVRGYWEIRPFNVDGVPHGGLSGPTDCLLKFGRMTLRQGEGEDGRVLSAQSVRAMLTPTAMNDGKPGPFGLAWRLGSLDGEPFVEHTGGGGGFAAGLRVYPRLGYVVAVAGNETGFAPEEFLRIAAARPGRS